MTDATTQTAPRQPTPLPKNARDILRFILDAGNTAFLDEADRAIAGTPDRPGQPVPGTALDHMTCVGKGLLAGERGFLIVRRRGRHLARHGTMFGFDDSVSDVDLAAWGRGEIDYLTDELLEAIDGRFALVATTRREALDLVIEQGLITAAEARQDV